MSVLQTSRFPQELDPKKTKRAIEKHWLINRNSRFRSRYGTNRVEEQNQVHGQEEQEIQKISKKAETQQKDRLQRDHQNKKNEKISQKLQHVLEKAEVYN